MTKQKDPPDLIEILPAYGVKANMTAYGELRLDQEDGVGNEAVFVLSPQEWNGLVRAMQRLGLLNARGLVVAEKWASYADEKGHQ